MHKWGSPHKLIYHSSGCLDGVGSAGPNGSEFNLPAAALSTWDGWCCPPFPSSVVVNGVLGMAGPAAMKYFSYVFLPWLLKAIPGRNDKSQVSKFFLLAQVLTKKDAVWECRDSLEILPHGEKFINREIKAKCRACPKWKRCQDEICPIPGVLGAELTIPYLITLSLKRFVKLPWGTCAMRSRDGTLCSQRQILLLSECLELKPFYSRGVVWGSVPWGNSDKHCSCLRRLFDSMKVRTWPRCKWVTFISAIVCVCLRGKLVCAREKLTEGKKGRRESWRQFWKIKNMFPATASSITS